MVYTPRYLDGKRVQLLDIYYSGVGILHELTPEEMEEAFQHHLTQRNKEKTAEPQGLHRFRKLINLRYKSRPGAPS